MIGKIRKYIPHEVVNIGYHLPQAVFANLKYGFPSRKIKIIGITGTDGKTTTTNMIYQILKDAGKSVSMISTINAEIAGKKYDTGLHVTNPDAKDIQKYLKQAVEAGDEYMVLEVTSHGLAQYRVWGVNFEVGVITNVTHEHLDYHGSFQNYLYTKAKLVKKAKFAVLNADDPSYKELKSLAHGQVISFGLSLKAQINPQIFPLKLEIPGEYNIQNAMAAAAAAQALGIETKIIKQSLERFSGLVGRMEEIKNNLGVKIVVDFAHTPNALNSALLTLRKAAKKRLISVFGAASERDVKKRPLMGEISAKIADITIITDEDPRFEDRHKICQEIAAGAVKAGAKEGVNLFEEVDREKAIHMAIKIAKPGDTIGIFGKGHEKSMNYQGKEKPWSDQAAVKKILNHG